ncbi:MFS general substrate transporter [Naematelia encephala]|uniref:MFS general substrate transporter n=1 Tax=Naematelia encephala TaxID=71784 RepID=A0A1Y2BGB1_9TREE|nr:MFS general substrate transporter [Naematelia encephala]
MSEQERIVDGEQADYGAIRSTSGSSTAAETDVGDVKAQPTPLDMAQIVLLSFARISEPLTFTILFPFVQQMIVDTGEVAIEDVGYSVGLIEVSFSITQSLSLLYWSRAADKYGRKPVLLASLFGAFVATVLFGFSKHVWQMYACRFLAGVFGGNAMVIRTLFTENSDRTNQAKAFAYFAFAANIGGLVGPTIGGFLSQPVKQWPRLFGRWQIFIDYPYCLPCLVAGLYIFFTLILSAVYLRETRPDECDNPIPIRQVLNKKILRMFGIFGWTVAVAFSLGAAFPLYLFTPVKIGGQGMTPPQIAQIQAAAGLSQGIWLLFAMPRLDTKLGTKRLFICISSFYPLVMIIPILANTFSRRSNPAGSWTLIALYVFVGQACQMTFTSVQLLLNACSPPSAIATVNGIAVAICGIVKSIFPAAINALFALSVSRQILGGYLSWIVMAFLAAGVFVISFFAPEDRHESDDVQKGRVMESEAEALN